MSIKPAVICDQCQRVIYGACVVIATTTAYVRSSEAGGLVDLATRDLHPDCLRDHVERKPRRRPTRPTKAQLVAQAAGTTDE